MAWARLFDRQQLEVCATCHTCEWLSTARNAHGTGVQHARRHGHTVDIVVTNQYLYGPRGNDATGEHEQGASSPVPRDVALGRAHTGVRQRSKP